MAKAALLRPWPIGLNHVFDIILPLFIMAVSKNPDFININYLFIVGCLRLFVLG
jgi:hypothetical protein